MPRAPPAARTDVPDSSFGNASEARFVLSRRYAAGTGGVRGLLITVLGNYVRRIKQPAPTLAFIDVMERLGVEETACRQALTRASADGWLIPEREGRYTWWRLSPAFEKLLNAGAQQIFGFTASQPAWDRRWLLVLARTVEDNRSGRHLLRTRLRWVGFGNPAPGTWITTHTDRIDVAEAVLREAGMHDHAQIFVSEHIGGADIQGLVQRAWDLDNVEREYEGFVTTYTRQPSTDPLVRLTMLTHAWRRLPLIDPALPQELLPNPWIGDHAVKLFHRQHAKWLPAATREWTRISQVTKGRPGARRAPT